MQSYVRLHDIARNGGCLDFHHQQATKTIASASEAERIKDKIEDKIDVERDVSASFGKGHEPWQGKSAG